MKNMVKIAAEKARQRQADYVLRGLAKGKSPKQLAEELGVSRQRIHQIKKAATP